MPKGALAFHIVQRGELGRRQTFLFRALAVLFALAMGALFLAILGYQPLAVYGTMVKARWAAPGCRRKP